MIPQSQVRKPKNSSRINLVISLVFHGLIIAAIVYFAAREGVLGKQLKKLAVSMVKEKPPEKPKEPEKPKAEPPKVETPKIVSAPKEIPKAVEAALPPAVSAPAVAPPAIETGGFSFEGGKEVITADANGVYKGVIENSLRSRWNRPDGVEDAAYIAEVQVTVSRDGQISNPEWGKKTGDKKWDDSVWKAVAATKNLSVPPPSNFPSQVTIRFDVEQTETIAP